MDRGPQRDEEDPEAHHPQAGPEPAGERGYGPGRGKQWRVGLRHAHDTRVRGADEQLRGVALGSERRHPPGGARCARGATPAAASSLKFLFVDRDCARREKVADAGAVC